MKITDKIEVKLDNISELLLIDNKLVKEMFKESTNLLLFKDEIIFEADMTRASRLTSIQNIAPTIFKHIIKVIRYKDLDKWYNKKHIQEMNSIIKKDIEELNIKGITKDLYYDYLFEVHIPNEDKLKRIITKIDKKGNYTKSKIKINDISYIYEQLQIIYTQLSQDLVDKKFVTLEKYIKEFINE